MGVSTTDAASALVDQLCSAIDSGKVAVGVFLDLSNAFDTPDRVIMKLRHAKAHNRPSVGVPWCSNQQVHLSSLLRVLELKGILSLPIPGLSLSTAVLLRNEGNLLKHHAFASAKSRGVSGTGDFTTT